MQKILSFHDSENFYQSSFIASLKKEISELGDDQIEEFEERAAIMEFEGGLSKEEAEWRALQIIQENGLKIAV